jgi:hypothetical protein
MRSVVLLPWIATYGGITVLLTLFLALQLKTKRLASEV